MGGAAGADPRSDRRAHGHRRGRPISTPWPSNASPIPASISLPRLPGLPDDAFRHDGQLTKREMRAATLAALAPFAGPAALGCRRRLRLHRHRMAARRARYAGDRRRERCRAPRHHRRECERARHAGDRDRRRGGAGRRWRVWPPRMRSSSAAALRPRAWSSAAGRRFLRGGRLVANAVTVEGETASPRHRGELGGSLTRIAISRAEPVGSLLGWRPLMPVTQWAAVKP